MIKKNGRKLKDGYQKERYKGKEIFIANYDLHSVAGIEPVQLNLFDLEVSKV